MHLFDSEKNTFSSLPSSQCVHEIRNLLNKSAFLDQLTFKVAGTQNKFTILNDSRLLTATKMHLLTHA